MNWARDEMDARVGEDIIDEFVGNLILLVLLITEYFPIVI